ncbi:MAG TPA: di-heme oxidoredictase family protein [Kofleriaceae bacterium]|nr:di-heme oxidoredictase family protein [Kofleriaceae bacterium]
MDGDIEIDSAQAELIADPVAFDDAVEAAAGQVMYQPSTASQITMAELKEPSASITAIGDPLPGTNAAAFAEARDAFIAEEEIDEGLGPIFNERGCGTCHTTTVVGGSGDQIERRFGRFQSNGTFFGFDVAPENHGGTLRQLMTNGTFVNGTTTCTIPLEVEPATATVKNVGRRTTALFGLGLMDSMPDAVFPQVQATQPASVRGIAQSVAIVLPDVRDPNQRIGSQRVGRFGWKGLVPSLLVFSGDAYLNEMGITTQSCVQGQSILAFANENFPNNVAPAAGCNGGDLAPPQPAGNGVPTFTDDAVGSCAGGLNEIQDDLVLFRTFMEHLAPPPRNFSQDSGSVINAGSQVFQAVGCAGCHVTGTFITPFNPFNGVPSRFQFQPFGDFMLHDMGSLGDRIGNTNDSQFRTRLMRTAPLWGARLQRLMLHDGRVTLANSGNNVLTMIRNAILAHDGTARTARDNFVFGISPSNQDLLLRYVRSL